MPIEPLLRLRPERVAPTEELPRLGRAQCASLGPTVRVLVWNILKARRRDFLADFAALVHDRDLVLLQEAVLNAPSDRLFADSRRHEWIMGRSFRDPSNRREHGVKTGSVASAIDAGAWQSPHAEPFSQTRKMLLATRYRLAAPGQDAAARAAPATTLLTLNMHAINFVNATKYLDHLGQLADALHRHVGPVILAGDFNTWSVRRRESVRAVARDASLLEAPLERRARVAHLSMHLDHVLYRGLELRQSASLGHVRSSDHAPITATFDHRPDETRP